MSATPNLPGLGWTRVRVRCRCGVEFDGVAEFKQAVSCDSCAAESRRLEAAAKIEADRRSKEADWAKLCPFPDTDPERLPKWLRAAAKWKPEDGNLILRGDTGQGKTRTAWLLLRRQHGAGRRFMALTHSELCRKLIGAMKGGGLEDYFETLAQTPLLLIDDLGNGSASEFQSGQLFDLIDARHLAKLPTIITTQYGLGELAGRCVPQRADAFDRRLLARCTELEQPKKGG